MSWTYYDVLGVERDAGAEEVRAAYRERVKEVHPDVSDHPDAEARFRAVARAREVLGDPAERARYDRLGHDSYVGAESPDTGEATRQSRATGDGGETSGSSRNRGHERARRRARRRADARASTADPTGASRGTGTGGGRRRRSTRGADGTGEGSGYRFSPGAGRGSPFTAERTALAAASVICYPVLLGAAFLAPVAVGLRVGAGVAALLLAVVTLAVPEAGVGVFATLTVAAPFVLSAAGIGLLSVTGVFAWAFCWVPLVVATANLLALRA